MDHRKRVLVVEDIPGTLAATVEEIRRTGHAVTECSTVAEAVSALSVQAFDLMILDWRIPGEDGGPVVADGGAAVLSAIRRAEVTASNAELPYVVVSGQRTTVRREDLDQGRCLGVVGKLSPAILDVIIQASLSREDR